MYTQIQYCVNVIMLKDVQLIVYDVSDLFCPPGTTKTNYIKTDKTKLYTFKIIEINSKPSLFKNLNNIR